MPVLNPRILVIGYGNPGRCDDGLGPALAAELEHLALPNVTIDADYQLTVEHAAAAAEHDVVIFADAAVDGPEPFRFTRIESSSELSFSTHSVEPPEVLGLAQSLFGTCPAGFVLGMRGYTFNEFGEELSAAARANLAAAVEFLRHILQEGDGGVLGIDPADAASLGTAVSLGDTTCKLAST